MGASLHGSISGQLPLCRRDHLVEELPGNLTFFGRVVITTIRPPILNICITYSNFSFSDMHLLHIVSLNTLENYKIHESNTSMGTLLVL